MIIYGATDDELVELLNVASTDVELTADVEVTADVIEPLSHLHVHKPAL